MLVGGNVTADNIVSRLTWLDTGRNVGDEVFFYFSGHGASGLVSNSTELDGKNEVICPAVRVITSDEINSMLYQPATGSKAVVVIDACQTGTFADIKTSYRAINTWNWQYPEGAGTQWMPGTTTDITAQGYYSKGPIYIEQYLSPSEVDRAADSATTPCTGGPHAQTT